MTDIAIQPEIDNAKLVASMVPITSEDRAFWEGTRVGELRLQYGSSGEVHFLQLPLDPGNLSSELEWRKASGRGRLWSWIVMHKNYLPAFAGAAPYVVGMIELEEGPMIISGLVGPIDNLRCDIPVEVVFENLDEERTLPKFRVVA